MFSALFAQPEALAEWRQLAGGLDKVRVQVYSEDTQFQALHWEALKDPGEAKPFCLKGVEFTRTSGAYTNRLEVRPGPCLNLLVVTARPGGIFRKLCVCRWKFRDKLPANQKLSAGKEEL